MDIAEIWKRCIVGIKTRTYDQRTICEIHREAWDIVENIEDDFVRHGLQTKLIIAYDMAKRMNAKLREYKKNWDEHFWEKNEDVNQDRQKRGGRN